MKGSTLSAIMMICCLWNRGMQFCSCLSPGIRLNLLPPKTSQEIPPDYLASRLTTPFKVSGFSSIS